MAAVKRGSQAFTGGAGGGKSPGKPSSSRLSKDDKASQREKVLDRIRKIILDHAVYDSSNKTTMIKGGDIDQTWLTDLLEMIGEYMRLDGSLNAMSKDLFKNGVSK
jgi:hypothetical protein